MTTVFTIIGAGVVFWWLVGILMLAFGTKAFVYPGTPLLVKLQVVGVSGFMLPYIFLRTGRIAQAVIQPVDMDEDDQAALREWLEANCTCPNCMRRRGEL